MTAVPTEKKLRQMPKGGRKGGAQFPRSTLDDALKHARKLVTKTHVAPIAQDAVYAGVVGAKSGNGNMRIAALKQYGYLEGRSDAYMATSLAKRSVAAPPEEIFLLHQEAALRPTIFKAIFDTFHGDVVSRAKLRQRAAELKVHPEETDKCVDIYMSTMSTAKLVHVDGDKVTHLAPGNGNGFAASINEGMDQVIGADEPANADTNMPDAPMAATPVGGVPEGGGNSPVARSNGAPPASPRAIFNVNITLDSSLDTDKLQKHLELLKRFGAI